MKTESKTIIYRRQIQVSKCKQFSVPKINTKWITIALQSLDASKRCGFNTSLNKYCFKYYLLCIWILRQNKNYKKNYTKPHSNLKVYFENCCLFGSFISCGFPQSRWWWNMRSTFSNPSPSDNSPHGCPSLRCWQTMCCFPQQLQLLSYEY